MSTDFSPGRGRAAMGVGSGVLKAKKKRGKNFFSSYLLVGKSEVPLGFGFCKRVFKKIKIF